MSKSEIWMDIIGYEGIYQVSNLGRVRSYDRYYTRTSINGKSFKQFIKGRIIKSIPHGDGYLYVSLNKDGCRKNYFVHRLVAIAFIPKPNNKDYVNHKDHNRSNNIVENLEWLTLVENLNYSIELGKHPRKTKKDPMYGIRIKNGKYEVGINHNYLGRYDDYEKALKVRNDYIDKYYN